MMGMFVIKLFVVVITFHLVEIVSSRDAPPIIIPDQGIVMGTYLKMYRTQNVLAYLGIPYAHPPLNEKRFTPPQVDNLPSWDGVRNATFFQPDCWQNPSRPLRKHDEAFRNLIKSARPKSAEETKRFDEDCLFVNIFIPDAPPPMEGYAVIAWLHSGDFSFGSPSDLDPFQLVFKQKVIVVTIAYRLNIFGFLTSMDGESPGNFGLMDQAAALLWIRRNIKLFGGNDNSITLMGHGSGAVSVGLHLTSGDWTDGLFHQAVMMSGSPLSEYAVRMPSEYAAVLDAISTAFGCIRRPTPKLMECLRSINPQILSDNLPYIEWGPIVDAGLSNSTAAFVPDIPRQLMEKGTLRHVPLLVGYTDMEEVLDIIIGDMTSDGIQSEIYDTLITDIILNDLSHLEANDSWCGNVQIVIDATLYVYKPYPPVKDPMRLRKMFIDFNTERKFIAPSLLLANFMSKHTTTYAYRFDIKPTTSRTRGEIAEWVGVPHNFDLIFVWGIPYWNNPDMIKQWDSTDKRVSDIIMSLWANFAKFSNPTKAGVYIKWDKFNNDDPQILVIDRAFNMNDEMNYRAISFWNDYFPKAVQHAANCCNATNQGFTFTRNPQVPTMAFTITIIVSTIFISRT